MLGHLGSDPSSATHQLWAFLLSEPHFAQLLNGHVVVKLQPEEGRKAPSKMSLVLQMLAILTKTN